jgi:rhodanese-related sulfurtransferase
VKHAPAFLKIIRDAKRRIREITPQQVHLRRTNSEGILLLDIREDHEWVRGHITGAKHLGKGIIERDIETLVPGKRQEIVLYCGGGYRSVLAADNLRKMGYRNVCSMSGGWRKWKELKFPHTKRSSHTK